MIRHKEKFISLEQSSDYLKMVVDKYGDTPINLNYYSDLIKALEYSLKNPHQEIWLLRIKRDEQLIGFSALIFDDRLPKKEALFGFFECLGTEVEIGELWNFIYESALEMKIDKLSGPVNGSIWHGYRFKKPGWDKYLPFMSEPVVDTTYYSYFEKLKNAKEILYYSGMRRNFSGIMDLIRPSYAKAISDGLTIVQPSTIGAEQLMELFNLSTLVFKNNWGFVPLSFEEFICLYSSEKISNFSAYTFLAYFNKRLIGFCACLRNQNQLILKTMVVHPEFQGKGLGNALVYKVHEEATKLGIYQIVYALIRTGNQIKYFPTDDAIVIREYACFEFKLN